MHIAFDCSSAARPEATGVAMYIRRMVQALGELDGLGADDRFTLLHRLSRWKHRRHFVAPPSQRFASKYLIEGWHPFFGKQVDVFHGLDARIPGPWMKARLVVTIHDVFSALQSKEFATEEFRKMKSQRYADLVKRADCIITVSEACKRDVLATLEPDESKVRVVYEAGGDGFYPRNEDEIKAARVRYSLEKPYLIFIGSINKRKNIPRMIQAFALARQRTKSDAQFVVAGRIGYGGEDIKEAIETSGAREYVKLLGYLPDRDVAPLYSGAWGLMFQTLYEGFGIPVIEAGACGCPILGGSKGSVPEIAGEAGLLADPEDVEAMAAQIEIILSDESQRKSLGEKARARSAEFSWDKAAQQCMDIYHELRER